MLKRKRKDESIVSHPPSIFPKFAHMDVPKKSRINANCNKKIEFTFTAESVKQDTLKDMISVSRTEDLMVRQDRVEEVRRWLCAEAARLRILLVTGPSGSGKYTTIKVVCKENDIEVMEYEQNQSYVQFRDEDGEAHLGETNQIEAFEDFIAAASKRSLGHSKRRKIVLVREIPNVFLRNPHKLTELLAQMRYYCRSSIVFCLTQIDSCWELNPRRFFSLSPPPEFSFLHLKFNPIPKTEVAKVIRIISDRFGFKVTPTFVNTVKEKSNGDLNLAINMLEISRLQSSKDMHYLLNSSDMMADFCHFIGKIVYAKREEPNNLTVLKRAELEKRIHEPFRRLIPPKGSLNDLLAMCPTGSRTLVDYLSEYKLKFLNNIHSLSNIYKDLSIANQIGCFYDASNDNILDKYAKELIISSSFYHTNGRATNKGMFTFTKPQGPTRDHLRGSILAVNKLYPGDSFTQLVTCTLPILSIMPSKATINEVSLIESLKWGK